MNHTRARAFASASALALTMALSSCSLIGNEGDTAETQSPAAGEATEAGGTVVLATHESFALSKKLIKAFKAETGYDLEIRGSGDAGTLATKLSLTADNPIGDAAFGIDNTFASRPLDAGAFAENEPESPAPDEFQLEEGADRLTAIDTGSVCVNVDTEWFAEQGLEPPVTLADLADPDYEGLFVTPGASTSSPGMAFFLATVAEYGTDPGAGWSAYWTDLLANGAKVVDGWEDAYYGDFTAGSDKGTRPIVLSYDSSPAFTVKGGKTSTAALLETCFRQVEYAGVLAGAENPAGAVALIDWLLTDEVQSQIPELMYMFPVSQTATVPEDWAKFAPQAETPYSVAPAEIAESREQWLTEWTDVISR